MAGAAVTPAPVAIDRKHPGPGRKFAFGPSLALLPFLAYLTVFLVVPTVTVLVGAFQADEGGFTLEKLRALNSEAARSALWNSILLSASTAVIGAVLGALLAYLVVTGRPTSILRRVVLAVCGVLAQFGGVTLAFAFIATVGFSGVLTEALRSWPGIDIFGGGWLFDLPGPDPGLHLLPDPADGHRLHAGTAGGPPAVARGGDQPRGQHPAVLDPGRVPSPDARLPRVDALVVRATRSRRTRRRRHWSARAARSRHC